MVCLCLLSRLFCFIVPPFQTAMSAQLCLFSIHFISLNHCIDCLRLLPCFRHFNFSISNQVESCFFSEKKAKTEFKIFDMKITWENVILIIDSYNFSHIHLIVFHMWSKDKMHLYDTQLLQLFMLLKFQLAMNFWEQPVHDTPDMKICAHKVLWIIIERLLRE